MQWTFGDKKNGLLIYECHGQLERFRNGSGCAFTPQSQPDPLRNRSTAITSRGGRLVPERLDAVEQVWTRATGTVPVPNLWCEHGLTSCQVKAHYCSSSACICTSHGMVRISSLAAIGDRSLLHFRVRTWHNSGDNWQAYKRRFWSNNYVSARLVCILTYNQNFHPKWTQPYDFSSIKLKEICRLF